MAGLCSALLLFACATPLSATAPGVQFLGVPTSVFTTGITFPIGMAEDASGNIYIAEYDGNAVYKETLQSNGTYVQSTVASGFSYGPVGLAVDAAGNIYIGLDISGGTSRLLKETLQGDGSYVQSYIGSGGTNVYGVAVDSYGNVYATNNPGTNTVIKYFPSGGSYTSAVIYSTTSTLLAGVAVDSSGHVFVTKEYGNTIYRLTPSGSPATATIYTSNTINIGTGSQIFDVALDPSGDMFVADKTGKIRLETPNGSGGYTEAILATGLTLSYGVTVGPSGTIYFGVSGAVDKLAPAAANLGSFNLGAASSVYTLNFRVQPTTAIGAISVVSQGAVNTASGSPEFVDGGGSTCAVQTFSALTVCSVKVKFTPQFTGLQTGAVEITDAGGSLLSTVYLYGVGKAPLAGFTAGTAAVFNVTGLGATPLNGPRHTVMDVAGNLFIADSGNNRIVEVAPGGSATVLSTPGIPLSNPTAVAIDGAGSLFIADSGNARVVKRTAQGVASVLDTHSIALGLNYGVAVDLQGNVYTSDATNNRVLVFPSNGSAHVFNFTGVTLGSASGVAVDGNGNLYISDQSNSTIVEVSNGASSVLNTGDLSPALANPTDVAVDAVGNVYIADTGNNRVVEVSSGASTGIELETGSYALDAPNCAVVGNVEDLYICDSGNNRIVMSDQKAAAPLTFAAVNTTQTLSLINLGNQPLTLSVPVAGKNPGFGSTNYELVNAGNTGYCPQLSTRSSSTSIPAGASCSLSVEFAPAGGAGGTITDSLTITDNHQLVPASTQTISLSGTALATPTVTLTPSPASPITYGQAQTSLAATVSYDSETPNGTVNFTDSSNSLGAATTLNAGSASFAAQYYAPGLHSLQADYSGDSNFEPASSPGVAYRVNKANTTISVPAAPVQVALNASGSIPVTIACHYSGSGISGPGGSITYSIANSGGTVVATGSVALASAAATIPLSSTLASGSYNVTLNYAGDNNYYAAAAAIAKLQIGAFTPTIVWAPPSTVSSGASLNGVLNATASCGGTAAAGGFAYTGTPAGGSPSVVTNATVLNSGNYMLTALFTPTDTSTCSPANATVLITVGKTSPTISWSAPTTITYGTNLTSILIATASNNGKTVPGNFSYTATQSGETATTVTNTTVLGVGSYALAAVFTPTESSAYNSASAPLSLTVNKTGSAAQLTSSANPVLVTTPVTLTVSVNSTAGTPTGTIDFLDGATLLGSAQLSSGVATLTLSTLSVASHSITASYSGDANSPASTSAVLLQVVVDFGMVSTSGSGGGGSGGSTPTQTVSPGGSATFNLSIVPTTGTVLPTPTQFTISGMPQGSVATVSPSTWTPATANSWTYPANRGLQNIVLTIQLPASTARNASGSILGLGRSRLLLGLLLLPFAAMITRNSRRIRNRLLLLVMICGGCLAAIALCSCASSGKTSAQSSNTYTITETVTSGAVSRATTVKLTVQ